MKKILSIALLIFISISCTYEPTGIEPFNINLEEPGEYGVFLSDGTRIDSLDTLNIYHFPYFFGLNIKFSIAPGAYDDTRISFQLNGKEIYSSKSTNGDFSFDFDIQQGTYLLEMEIIYKVKNGVFNNLLDPIVTNKSWVLNYDLFPNSFKLNNLKIDQHNIELSWDQIDHPALMYYDLYDNDLLIKRFYPEDECNYIYKDFLSGEALFQVLAYYRRHDFYLDSNLYLKSNIQRFGHVQKVECKEYDHIRYEIKWNAPFSIENFGKYELQYKLGSSYQTIYTTSHPEITSTVVDLGLVQARSSNNYIRLAVLPYDSTRSRRSYSLCSFALDYNSDKFFRINSFDNLLHTYDNSKIFYYDYVKAVYRGALDEISFDGISYNNKISNIALSENGDYFIISDQKMNIVIPNFENGTFESLSESLNIYNSNSKFHNLSVSNNGILIISQYNPEYEDDRSFKVVDIESDETIYMDNTIFNNHVGISFDGSRVLARDVESEQIILYELDNDGNVNEVNSIEVDPLKSDFKFIPNSDDFVVLNNGTLTVYDENMNLRSSVSTDCDKILDVDYTNNYIALFRNYKCLIYDLNTMELKYSTFVAYETVAFMDSYLYSHGVKQRIEY
jgi:hypothetical protein